MFSLYGQESSENQETSTDSIVASIGLMGAAQALTAYENYLAYQSSWLNGAYFEAGAFLGAAMVDGFIVAYLFLLAGALNGADTGN